VKHERVAGKTVHRANQEVRLRKIKLA
jgi:hypothetical protein